MFGSIVTYLATAPSPIVKSPPSGPQLEEETQDKEAGTSDRHVKSLIITRFISAVKALKRKNSVAIKDEFADLSIKTKNILKQSNITIIDFKLRLRILCGDVPDFDDFDKIFDYYVKSEEWSHMNSDVLCQLIEKFGDNELKKLKKEFEEKKAGYLVATKISDYITMNTVSNESNFTGGRRRSSKGYRDQLKIKLKLEVNISKLTLKYITDLWKNLKCLNLPKIYLILDSIVSGSLWVTWSITLPHIASEFQDKVKHPEALKFFKDNLIVQVLLNGQCLYSANGEELTDSVKSCASVFSPSGSIDEDVTTNTEPFRSKVWSNKRSAICICNNLSQAISATSLVTVTTVPASLIVESQSFELSKTPQFDETMCRQAGRPELIMLK